MNWLSNKERHQHSPNRCDNYSVSINVCVNFNKTIKSAQCLMWGSFDDYICSYSACNNSLCFVFTHPEQQTRQSANFSKLVYGFVQGLRQKRAFSHLDYETIRLLLSNCAKTTTGFCVFFSYHGCDWMDSLHPPNGALLLGCQTY